MDHMLGTLRFHPLGLGESDTKRPALGNKRRGTNTMPYYERRLQPPSSRSNHSSSYSNNSIPRYVVHVMGRIDTLDLLITGRLRITDLLRLEGP